MAPIWDFLLLAAFGEFAKLTARKRAGSNLMSAVEDLEVDGEIGSSSVEIAVKLRSILGELDRLGESMAAIHVNSAIEALQVDQGN